MPRSKKDELVAPEAITEETLAEDASEENDELEALEAQALDEGPTQKATLSNAADAQSKKTRAPRKRKPAQEKTPLLQSMAQPANAPSDPSTTKVISEVRDVPSQISAVSDAHLREDAVVAEVSIQKSMESMVRQWASVKDISSSVCTNLEKVAGLLHSLEGEYSSASSALAKEDKKKSSTVAKVAAGMSAAALLFSILSFSLAQSLRRTVIEATASTNTVSKNEKEGLAWRDTPVRRERISKETSHGSARRETRSLEVKRR